MTETSTNFKRGIFGFLVVALICGAGAFYALTPSRYVSLDVNPSIELQVNRLGQVVTLVGANEDAQMLLADYQPTDRSLDLVVAGLMDRLVEAGYLTEDQKNDVLITTGEDQASQELLDQVSKQVAVSLAQHALVAEVVTQRIVLDPALEAKAAENQVSAGKMAVMDRLMAQDATLTAEDLATTRVEDLLGYAASRNISLNLMEEQLEDLQDRTPGGLPQLEGLEEGLDEAADGAEEAEDAAEDEAELAKEAAEDEADAAEEAAEKAEDAAEEAADRAREAAEDKADAAKEAAEKAEDAAKEAADQAREEAEEKAAATEKAKEATEKAEEAAEEAADQAREEAEEKAAATEKAKEAAEEAEDAAEEAADQARAEAEGKAAAVDTTPAKDSDSQDSDSQDSDSQDSDSQDSESQDSDSQDSDAGETDD